MKNMIVFITLIVTISACTTTSVPAKNVTNSTMSPSEAGLYRAEHKGNNPPSPSNIK